jgi:TM2 domain-containing membrane protein YozV
MMENPYVIGIISWFLPGVGHLIQGRIRRGLIIGAVIWIMFIIAVVSGGAYYPGFDFKDGSLLYLLNIFSRLGNGLGALISFVLMTSPPPNVAAWATFEYGGRFLEIAGLLNFLAVMDAFDISIGRKK